MFHSKKHNPSFRELLTSQIPILKTIHDNIYLVSGIGIKALCNNS